MKSPQPLSFITPLFLLSLITAGATFSLVGCNDDSTSPAQAGQTTTSLYVKYGGQPTVTKIVDDAVTGLIADCSQNPYFTTVLDTGGNDSTDRLKSCLDLFFNNALGGGATYPGPSTYRGAPPDGYPCEDMSTIHTGLGIPSDVFDQFVTDLGVVLKKNGFEDADVTTVAKELVGLKIQIVAPPTTEKTYDYTPTSPPNNGCVASPDTNPAPSPTASYPSATPQPTPRVSPMPFPSLSL